MAEEDEAKSRGNAAFSAGNFSEAITHFTEAISISPNNHILYSNRSAAYASLSNFTQALTDAKKTVEIKPEWSKGYSRLGAASAYKKGLQLDPTNNVLKSGLTEANYALAKASYSPKQWELKNAFNATKPVEELLETYQQMETCFDKVLLIVECVNLMKALQGVNRREDGFVFLQKVDKLMHGDNSCPGCSLADNSVFSGAKTLNKMGSASLISKDYDASFKFLSFANTILTELEQDESCRCDGKCLLRALEFNLYKLYKVTLFTDKFKESALYAIKHLEVQEKLLEKDCMEIATANLNVFFAYGSAMNFKDSLPYGLKALEIQIKHLGNDSVEVANQRFNLSVVYSELGEHEKGLELRELSDSVLKGKSCDSIDMLLAAGRYEEVISVLKDKVTRVDLREEERGLDHLYLGFAFFEVGKFPDAKEHLRTAQETIEKYPGCINYAAALLLKVSECYNKMNDTEGAISLIKKVLAVPDLPQNLLSQAASNLFSLIHKSGTKAKEEIPYMLDAVEKLKLSFGLEHCEVGYGYGNLGVAYMNSGQQELAVKFMEDAKSILDATVGPNDIGSLKTSHTLSELYGDMGRFARALEIEKNVVQGLKGLAPSELGFMHEVNKHLSKMKVRVAESPVSVSSQSNDVSPSAKISKSDISDDGKGT